MVGSRGSASIDATNGNTPPNNQGEAASFYPITGIPRKYLNSSRKTLSTGSFTSEGPKLLVKRMEKTSEVGLNLL